MAFIAAVLLCATYEVGDGKTYASLTDVPWESLAAGDVVQVHPRAAPYAVKWAMTRAGVTVRGVPSGSGALPVITGQGATTRSGQTFANPDRTLVMVAADGVVLESLHFLRARQGDAFTAGDGSTGTFASGVSAIDAVAGSNVTIRGCTFEDLEKGVYVATDDAVIEGNVFRANRAGGNLDLTGARPVVRFNALRAPTVAAAENVRDNAAGAVVAYNFIAGGNRLLDIEGIGAPGGDDFLRTRVFGNVLVKDDFGGNNAVVHFDTQAGPRRLDLYANTIVVRRDLARVVQLAKATVELTLVNNVVRARPTTNLVMVDGAGDVRYGGNWLQRGRTLTQSGTPLVDLGGNLDGDDPGFRDELSDDFRLSPSAAVIDRAMMLPSGLDAPAFEFRAPAGSAPRGDDSKPDIGAFEEVVAVVQPDGGAGKVGLVGWRLGCAAAPGQVVLVLAVMMSLMRRRRLRSR
ncbi:MAG: right-handed parallel beta-helix repeat-containing protein [Myxococcaceae bacterium]|nr:right-handed parallel beta-helix repeat-containing protein [Myxococcaceae bacterium]